MQHYLEKFVQQECEPIRQHLLRHRLRSARGQRGVGVGGVSGGVMQLLAKSCVCGSDHCFIIQDVEEVDNARTKRRDTETLAERRYPAQSLRTRAPVSAARAEDIWVMT